MPRTWPSKTAHVDLNKLHQRHFYGMVAMVVSIVGGFLLIASQISTAVLPWRDQVIETSRHQAEEDRRLDKLEDTVSSQGIAFSRMSGTLDVIADKVAHIDDYYRRAERRGVQ